MKRLLLLIIATALALGILLTIEQFRNAFFALFAEATSESHAKTHDPSLLQITESASPFQEASIQLSRRAYDYGVFYWRKGSLMRSLEAFDLAIRFDPKFALAYAVRATVRSQRGDQQAAIDDADKAIDLDPNLAVAYYNRGVANGRLRNWSAAAIDYREAIRIDPKYGKGEAHNNLGSALMAQGKYEEAIEAYSRAILLSNEAVFFFNRSLTYQRAGNYQEALGDFDSAVKRGLLSSDADHHRAWLLLKQGKDADALRELNRVIDANPSDANAIADRAMLYERLGNKQAAQQDFSRVAEITSVNPRELNHELHLLQSLRGFGD